MAKMNYRGKCSYDNPIPHRMTEKPGEMEAPILAKVNGKKAVFAAKLHEALGKAYLSQEWLMDANLKRRDYRLLLAVKNNPGRIQSFFAKQLRTSASNMSVDVRRLVGSGHLCIMKRGAPTGNERLDASRKGVLVLGTVRLDIEAQYEKTWDSVLKNQSPIIRAFVAMMDECGVPDDD